MRSAQQTRQILGSKRIILRMDRALRSEMAAYAADLALWEAVRDGNLSRAAAALEVGADPNRPLAVSKVVWVESVPIL